jgi:fructose-1,6-bisphosphatase/inositol monophosphatase family enzyme
MNETELSRFVASMTAAVLAAGEHAAASQGTVQNIGKEETEVLPDSDNAYVQKRRSAKSVIDEQVQEMLLRAAIPLLSTTAVRVDAEEDTPTKQKLHREDAAITLVIDPIDGTLEYLNGSDTYSICVALVEDGRVRTAIVYFAARRTLYVMDGKPNPRKIVYSTDNTIITEEILPSPTASLSDIIYTNSRVPEHAIKELSEECSVVRDIDNEVIWPEALLKCISGEYQAAIFVRPQIRDVLIGAMLSNMPNGFAVDFSGNTIQWPNGGRIPEVAFGFGRLSETIKKCLRSQELRN